MKRSMTFLVNNMYTLIFSRRAAKVIKSMNKEYKDRLKELFEKLRENPFSYPL